MCFPNEQFRRIPAGSSKHRPQQIAFIFILVVFYAFMEGAFAPRNFTQDVPLHLANSSMKELSHVAGKPIRVCGVCYRAAEGPKMRAKSTTDV